MIFVRDFLKDQQILRNPAETPNPLVSVILPTYSRCREGLLERSIRSVLAQGLQDFELIVMDDGSTDGSNELIEKYRAQDSRMIHVRHEQNCGLPALRVNEGIELARGRYLAFQFDDDLWRENTLHDLVAGAKAHSEPVVVVGRSLFTTRVGKHILPAEPVTMVTLQAQNRFANNSVLFPRSLVDRYGMYDPHIGMRRLCDWDLWLRLIRHVPFVTLDEIVSEVFEANTGAIGVTVPWDLALFYFLHSIPRNQNLTPANWREYALDTLRIPADENGVNAPREIRRRLYEDQLVPYYFKMRHVFPGLGSFPATMPHRPIKNVLYTKLSYDVSTDVTVGHYDALTVQRDSYKSYYQSLEDVKPGWVNEADLLLLMRTVEDEAVDLAEQAIQYNRPCGYYLDDDLLTFHEYGPQFDYLAPDTPYYNNLTHMLGLADAVLVTNEFIGASVRPYNPRLIPHNNAVPADCLPSQIHPRRPGQFRIGYVGSGYRIEEFRLIWDALLKISQEYGDRLSFEFWGIDVSSLPPLSSPVIQKPFTFSYNYYLEALRNADFDILLTPLLDYPRPRLGKSLIKYYETAVAGALGIFSDVPQYQQLPGGFTCLKAANDVDGWYQALRQAIEMDADREHPDQFDQMRRRCLEHVREEHTAEAQIDYHEAALRAIEFHAKTRARRHSDGRPRVMYVLHSAHYGGAEIQLWRRLRLAKAYGIQPIVVIPGVLRDTENGIRLHQMLEQEGIDLEAVEYTCFTEPRSPEEFFSDLEREQIRALLKRCQPALVHTVTFIPSFGQVCQEEKIPLVATLYAVQDDFAWPDGQPGFVHCSVVQSDCLRYTNRWSQLLGGAPKVCARDMAPLELFQAGQRRRLEQLGNQDSGPSEVVSETTGLGYSDLKRQPHLVVTGTFQERKQQLETIEAIGRLKQEGLKCQLDFYGYTHFFPEYMEKCHKAIATWGLESQVNIHEFTEDLNQALQSADALLSLSTYESFPGSIKDALAAGIFIVATPVGGISELIIDNVSGILCKGTSVEELAEGIRRAITLPSVERNRIAEQGRRIARLELHPYRTANDLFRMYNTALTADYADFADYADEQAAKSIAIRLPRVSSTGTVKRTGAARRHEKMKSPTSPPASTLPVGKGLYYTFEPRDSNWSGLDILIGTHARPASGELVLRIHTSTSTGAAERALRSVRFDLQKARDNDWVELRFPPIRNAQGHKFILEFTLANPGPQTLISLYQSAPLPGKAERIYRRIARELGAILQGEQLYCREWYQ